MAYTANNPVPVPTAEELRARIPGWGADLNPLDRPSVPKLQFDPGRTGAHWDFPDRQEETYPRERSIEHGMLTPVFGTSVPLKGVSGVMRRYAYRRYSEARAAHWLILLAADRVDALEARISSLATLRPDNPVTETGVLSEFRRGGVSSRAGRRRADVNHQWIDPVLVGLPWVLAGGAAFAGVRALLRLSRRVQAR
ncbi:hypothetical protein [Arthrobacter sp. 7Tela_A1]|uniref:hypothetical protein n=1 Tax=Arthrobacter sp. 7Tela_A1 TaxID=3093745 RepID=UPI003BB5E889